MTVKRIPFYFYNHFEKVQSLEEYFNLEFKTAEQDLTQLNDCIVVIPDTYSNLNYFPKQELDLDTLLDNIVASLVNESAPPNVLKAHGSCVDLRTNNWKALLLRVGTAMIMRLLLNNIILKKLPNNSFMQLAGYPIDKRLEEKKCKGGQYKLERTNVFLSNSVRDITAKVFNNNNSNTRKRKKDGDDDDDVNKKKKNKKPKSDNCMTIDMNRSALIGPYPPKTENVPEQEYAIKTLKTLFIDDFRTDKKRKKFLKRFSSLPEIVQKIHKNSKLLPKRSFRDYYCPINGMSSHSNSQVYMFITSYIKKCIPLEVFGSVHNLQVLLRAIFNFISRKSHEELRMDEVLYQFKINHCQWLSPLPNTRSPPSDEEKKKFTLTTLIKWIFDNCILPLIKRTFHVTLHSNDKNKLYYFRHDVWNRITKNYMDSLVKAKYFIQVDKRKLLGLRLGSGKLKFVPKNSGLRAITNLSNTVNLVFDPATSTIHEKNTSTNKLLKSTLTALKHERIQQPEVMGGSVFGNNLLYARLKEYKQKKVTKNSKFYFCKVDAKNCFDSINQEKLLVELEQFLSSSEYIFKYILKCSATAEGRVFTVKDFVATTKDQKYPLSEYINGMGGGLSGSVTIEQVTSFKKKVSELHAVLKEHIMKSTVKYNGRYYKKDHGIPQGSCLSSLLCSLFYGRLEQEKLGVLKQDNDGILLHYLDDFLYITKNIYYAKLFRDIMNEGFSDFGFEINQSKTLTNVDIEMSVFPWLSFVIDVKTLDVSSNRSITYPKIHYANKPGKHLFSAIKSSLNIGAADNILMDTTFNSEETVLKNMKQNFRSAAIKMEMVIYKTRRDYANERFMFNSIIRWSEEVISYTPNGFDKNDILRIYLEEFYKIFIKKKKKYPRVLSCLKACIKKHTYTNKIRKLL